MYVAATESTFENPAAIPDPTEQLPLHQLVQRAIVLRLALDTRYLNTTLYDNADRQPRPSVPHVIIALRMLICAYPEGLLRCHKAGCTPLSAVLSQSAIAPSVEMIEYLTGIRLQLKQIPAWANDLPHLARDSPAMIASEELQLHAYILPQRNG